MGRSWVFGQLPGDMLPSGAKQENRIRKGLEVRIFDVFLCEEKWLFYNGESNPRDPGSPCQMMSKGCIITSSKQGI